MLGYFVFNGEAVFDAARSFGLDIIWGYELVQVM